ncbi:hypothetical protein [Simiduia aestuariiviva]|uniref:Uncharacterized protein n=1 Tax=Simiduia aestuariiviva TaxID=1510459 RepID=A0A839UT00_9GAMM|nr:hypothetical protein [Simiduia aestuariiviva]MBB3169841.1 hypothetical protein [Simiduia aestuariiviva]
MKLVSYSIFILLLILTTACTEVRYLPIMHEFNSDKDVGYLVISISYSGTASHYSVRFNKVNQSSTQTIEISPGRNWDIDYPGTRGRIVAVALEPGEYEITSWSVYNGGFGLHANNNAQIPFQIVPKSMTYYGNFHFLRTAGFGATITDIDVQYSDRSARDIPLIAGKYIYLKSEELKVGKIVEKDLTNTR